MAESWRVCMICTIKPIADGLAGRLRELGHEPVVLVAPRRTDDDRQPEALQLTASSAPPGLDLLFAKDKWSLERLLRAYEPDLAICWGFPWKIPQAALDVPRLGSINHHPALLPQHRGPIPFAWTLRAGDTDWGFTWHRMDAELDTGNLLSQGTAPVLDDDVDIAEFGPRLLEVALGLLPRALDRVAAGDPGDPQPDEGATWAGHFEDDDYVRVDWSHPART
ncbi:MAG: formyltransferase family protein, partial [Gaiellaceae bacterium]